MVLAGNVLGKLRHLTVPVRRLTQPRHRQRPIVHPSVDEGGCQATRHKPQQVVLREALPGLAQPTELAPGGHQTSISISPCSSASRICSRVSVILPPDLLPRRDSFSSSRATASSASSLSSGSADEDPRRERARLARAGRPLRRLGASSWGSSSSSGSSSPSPSS